MSIETKFYSDLEVTPDANTEQIASAYRRLSIQLHPLRNPISQKAFFTAKFAAISQAYEVLSNPKTKDVYDQYGFESLSKGVESGEHIRAGYTFMGNPFKIFFDFFGSENPWCEQIEQINPISAVISAAQESARSQDVEVEVQCSLFEFYNGALKEISYQIEEVYAGSDETKSVEKMITITVKPGYGEHTSLRFPRLGNQSYGAHPSDLIIKFVLAEPTGGYQRDGDDLHYHVNLSLIEALEATPTQIKTLDGRSILVTPNQMITPQTKVVLENEGMPTSQTGNFVVDVSEQLIPLQQRKKGNLIVQYNIGFPKKILSHHKEAILQALAAQ